MVVDRIVDYLERTPLGLRILAVASSISILEFVVTGNTRMGVATGIAGLAYILPAVFRGSINFSVPSLHRWRFNGEANSRDERGSPLMVLEVKLPRGGWDSSQMLAKTIMSRSRQSKSRYVIINAIFRGHSKILVGVSSSDWENVKIDFEVLKSIITSSVDGARVEPVSDESIARAFHTLSSGLQPSRESPPIVAPPPASSATPIDGAIFMGVRIDSESPEPVFLSATDIDGHIGVFGSTGSGKSTTLAILACRSSRHGYNVVVLDWAGEYASIIGRFGCNYQHLNPMENARVDPLSSSWDNITKAGILASALGLTEPQHYLLLKTLEDYRPSSIRELFDVIASLDESSRWDREVKRGLLRKIGVFTSSIGSKLVEKPDIFLDSSKPTIIDASVITNTSLRRAYSILLMASLYRLVIEGVYTKIFLVVDESHNLIHGEAILVEDLLAESRKYGFHLAISTQNPSLLPPRAIANTNTKIIHSIKGWRDLEAISLALSLPKPLLSKLPYLGPGEAVVSAPSLESPVLAKILLREEPSYI